MCLATRLAPIMSFCSETPKLGVPKCPKLKLLRLWKPIIFFGAYLWLRQSLKRSCSPYQKKFNSMWHATYTQVNQGNSWLLMVKSQIHNLISNLSFGHNLFLRYPNGSCEPILNIYVLKNFPCYKKLFNPMSFDPYNRSFKIWSVHLDSNSQSGNSFGSVEGSFPHIFLHSRKHEMWLPGFTLSPRTFVSPYLCHDPRLGLQHSPSLEEEVNVLTHIYNLFLQCNWFHLDPWPSISDFYSRTLP